MALANSCKVRPEAPISSLQIPRAGMPGAECLPGDRVQFPADVLRVRFTQFFITASQVRLPFVA